jgi:hypothetical protein
MSLLPLAFAAVAAAPTWGVVPFEAPDPLREDVDTLRLMLVTELEGRGVNVDRSSASLDACGEPACAAEAARTLGVARAVGATVSRFGEKVLVAAVFVTPEGDSESRRIVVDRVEDFDVAARRLAAALLQDQPVDKTAKLGDITALETERERRRRGLGGLTLGVGGVVPIDGTYAGNAAGLALQLGYWFEAKHFAVETSLGFRFSTDPGGDREFYDVPLYLGGYWIPGLGDFTPFLGGGLGLRYLYEERPGTVRVGEVIVTEHQGELSDDGFAPAAFAKAGVLILRTYRVRASVSVAYEVAFRDLNDGGYPQTVLALATVHF